MRRRFRVDNFKGTGSALASQCECDARLEIYNEESSLNRPLSGLGAGQGLLVVPAGKTVFAFFSNAPPPAPSIPIPALSDWMLFVLVLLLSVLAVGTVRRGR
jgi:hypothetical protein